MFGQRRGKKVKEVKRNKRYSRLCKRVIDALFKKFPDPIEQGDLCAMTNIPTRQLTYLFQAFPEQLSMVEITQKENDWRKIKHYSLNLKFLSPD